MIDRNENVLNNCHCNIVYKYHLIINTFLKNIIIGFINNYINNINPSCFWLYINKKDSNMLLFGTIYINLKGSFCTIIYSKIIDWNILHSSYVRWEIFNDCLCSTVQYIRIIKLYLPKFYNLKTLKNLSTWKLHLFCDNLWPISLQSYSKFIACIISFYDLCGFGNVNVSMYEKRFHLIEHIFLRWEFHKTALNRNHKNFCLNRLKIHKNIKLIASVINLLDWRCKFIDFIYKGFSGLFIFCLTETAFKLIGLTNSIIRLWITFFVTIKQNPEGLKYNTLTKLYTLTYYL